jgi:hypothetical protein
MRYYHCCDTIPVPATTRLCQLANPNPNLKHLIGPMVTDEPRGNEKSKRFRINHIRFAEEFLPDIRNVQYSRFWGLPDATMRAWERGSVASRAPMRLESAAHGVNKAKHQERFGSLHGFTPGVSTPASGSAFTYSLLFNTTSPNQSKPISRADSRLRHP